MTDKPTAPPAPDPEVQDTAEMLGLYGRHEGHSLTRVGQWWLCSCSKEVKPGA